MKIKLGELRSIIREVADEWQVVYDEYSDVYKEKNGIRPRWITPETTPLQKLKQMLEDLYNEPSTFDDEYGY